ncbi:hypothetical protein AMJ57_02905 [Parcubacteria bacterium SG8_24]|nr:MAG: hypothetical protein AMJ57_02905 [Parcubacteria bacterium SG8_24]
MTGTVSKPKGPTALTRLLPVVTVLAALLYAGAAYYLLFVPKLGQIVGGGEFDTTAIRQQVSDTRSRLEALKEAFSAYSKLNPEHVQRLKRIVPDDADIPGLFVQIDNLARKRGMVLVSVDAVVDDKAASLVGVKPVRISVNIAGGDYERFRLLLSDIELSLRLFDVQSIVFTPTSENYSMLMNAYFLDKSFL